MRLLPNDSRPLPTYPGKTIGIRVKMGTVRSNHISQDTYRLDLRTPNRQHRHEVAICAKALVNVTRQHKLAFHFIKASMPTDYREQYFTDNRLRLTDTYVLPPTIARALGLSTDLHFLAPGQYRVIDLGDHLTVVIPLHCHTLLAPAVGL